MLIRNYGLFWQRDDVFWGRGGVSGHMMGQLKHGKRSDPVDFRDQQGVYVLYDDAFKIVYVGQSGGRDQSRLFRRLRNHTKGMLANRWTQFSWFGIRSVTKTRGLKAEIGSAKASLQDALNHIEAVLIASSEPPLNRQGGRFGTNVEQYFQWRDDHNLGPDKAEMIRQIWEKTHQD